MERDTEQPLLAGARSDPIGDVEEWLIGNGSVAQDHDPPWLFDNKQTAAAIARVSHIHRAIYRIGDQRKAYPAAFHRRTSRRWRRCCGFMGRQWRCARRWRCG